jgi:hypothetical protein
MSDLTDKEKRIYNCYLYYSRKGKPFSPRKDFSDLEQKTFSILRRIYYFLEKYPHIKYEDFFKAPYHLHPDEKYPDLAFFTTLAATKNYSIFKKQQEDDDPEKQFDLIKESFHFIGMFCLENKITLEKYATHKTGYMVSWLNHYREHRINPYSLMEIENIFNSLSTLERDEVELFAKNLSDKLVAYKTRYINSPKTKTFVKEATTRIKNYLKNNLQR